AEPIAPRADVAGAGEQIGNVIADARVGGDEQEKDDAEHGGGQRAVAKPQFHSHGSAPFTGRAPVIASDVPARIVNKCAARRRTLWRTCPGGHENRPGTYENGGWRV